MIGPYVITIPIQFDDGIHEVVFENYWQASKVYPSVAASRQIRSRFDPTVIWEYPAAVFYQEGKENKEGEEEEPGAILPVYLDWREKLMLCPIR